MSTISTRTVVALGSLLLATAARAEVGGDSLAGRWRPADEPAAVVGVVCTAGSCDGRLVAHPDHPDRVGSYVLRGLRWQPERQRWVGQAYAARLDRLLDAEVVPDGADRFTLEVHTWLGTRQVPWQRLPAAEGGK